MRRPNLVVILLLVAIERANPSVIGWTQWGGDVVGVPGSASGTNAATGVSIYYSGEVRGLIFNYPSWGPTTTFSGGDVGNPPSPSGGIIEIFGGTNEVNTIAFSKPVANPVIAIWSLGGNGISASFAFQTNQPITIESGGPSYEYIGSSITQVGNTIYGVEGNGTIEFHGVFTQIAWTNPNFEAWYGFTVGVHEPVALLIVQTNRSPKTTEIGQSTIPTDTNYFKVFTNGTFQSGIALDPNKTTIVLTHGWNDSPTNWAQYTAQIIQQRIGANTVNLVAWDWSSNAASAWYDLGAIAAKTKGQGFALGTNLVAALGANYAQKIHFVGHSLGTLVNAAAADYVHDKGFSPANTQMTLCDEAEIAWGFSANKWHISTSLPATVLTDGINLGILSVDSSVSLPCWGRALPQDYAWADNYISAFGLLHGGAANAILTYASPSSSPPDFGSWLLDWQNFHDYGHYFYEDTIEPGIFNTGGQTNATYMGFVCSFEGGGSASRPANGTIFYQAPDGLELNLVPTNLDFSINFLNSRFTEILGSLTSSGVNWALNTTAQVVGQVTGSIDYTGNLIINLFTGGGSGSLVGNSPHPLDGPTTNGGGANNSPAYAWISLAVPSNAVSMSFDFMLEGDGASDSFQAALNGTNILSLETILIQTNVMFNSGMIDVTAYAGQTNEFFVGIVGGTSTNAQLTVQNVVFYSALAPSLHAQTSGTDFILTWPMSAQNFSLQTTTNLTDPNSWTTLTNVPAIVNLQNAVTNPVSGGAQFYRLKK